MIYWIFPAGYLDKNSNWRVLKSPNLVTQPSQSLPTEQYYKFLNSKPRTQKISHYLPMRRGKYAPGVFRIFSLSFNPLGRIKLQKPDLEFYCYHRIIKITNIQGSSMTINKRLVGAKSSVGACARFQPLRYIYFL